MTTRLPDFLVIGAARAGTTALHGFLRQHPGIFMPARKEPNFFAYEGEELACEGPGADYINNSIVDPSAYSALFAEAPADARLGEASPLYLYSERAPGRIKHHIPGAKMIVILRNPVDQAYSHFMYATKQCIENVSDFDKALTLERMRLDQGWQPLFGYSQFPRYGEQLARYFELFPRDQFLIKRYEDYQADPDAFLRAVYEFIGVDPDFVPTKSDKVNAGGVPKNQAFQDFLMKPNPVTKAVGLVVPQETRLKIRDWMARKNMNAPETLSSNARAMLLERLSDDIRALETLLDWDLSAWMR
ncbi:MAG: sulfotransferase [Henriciella sp.]|nr:sulfotransferase [Henriciella sp.]